MDKVDFSLTSLINPALQKKSGAKKAETYLKGRRKGFFTEMLEGSARGADELGPLLKMPPSEEALTKLMDAVHSTGSDLIDRPFHDEILQYKKAVRNFVNYVVANGYEILKIQGAKMKESEWKPNKIHYQIQIVDQKLEELAAVILSSQSSQLQRVSKIDEIKGLLVDLTITGKIKERND